jgi:hypothetical protein
LPEEYNTILYFTDQEMEALKGSALYGKLVEMFEYKYLS